MQHGLKRQLASLASRQKSLVKALQKQMDLVQMYATMKPKLFTQSTNHEGSTVVRQPYHFSTATSTLVSTKPEAQTDRYQDSQRNTSYGPVKRVNLLRLAPPNNATNLKVPTPPAPLLTQGKKTRTQTDVLKKEARSCQSGTPQQGNTLECNNFQIKVKNALMQTQEEDKSRHLSKLIQRGIIPFGSALQLLFKVRQNFSLYKTFLTLYDSIFSFCGDPP